MTATDERLLLNGFRLSLSSRDSDRDLGRQAETFSAYSLPLAQNQPFKELRAQHPDWFLSWRDGTLYGIPCKEQPSTIIGQPCALRCDEHLSLLAARIENLLPEKFPGYKAFWQRPFSFVGKRDEIVDTIAGQMHGPPALLGQFSIRPTFVLEAKIVESVPNASSIGLFLTVQTKWEVHAELQTLVEAGIDLAGLYVVRKELALGERASSDR